MSLLLLFDYDLPPTGDVSTDSFEVQRSYDGVTWERLRTVEGDGLVSPARVVAVGAFADTADATTHNANLPVPADGVKAGDLLIAFAAMDGNPTVGWPEGWIELKDEAGNGSAVRVACAYKRATGDERGTIAVTTSAAEGGAIRILCVRGAHLTQAPEISTGVNGSGASSGDPDALDPAGWAIEKTLWIAAMGNDGDVAVTAGPSGYYEFGNTRWANATGAGISTAYRRNTVSSENPGVFTHAAEDNRAFTVAVRLASPNLVAYDWEAPNGQTATYRVRAVHNFASGGTSVSAWVQTSTLWSSTSWWLKHPADPTLNLSVPRARVFSQPGHRRPGRQGRFQPLGRSDVIVVSDKRGPAEGDLVIELDTEQEAIDALLDSLAPLLIQAPGSDHWPDRWVRISDQERARLVDKLTVEDTHETLPWVEVARPTDNLETW
jgi:hypothetical protein